MLRLEQPLRRTLQKRDPLFTRVPMEERDEEVPYVNHDLRSDDREHEADGYNHGVVHVPPAPLPVDEQVSRQADEHQVDS